MSESNNDRRALPVSMGRLARDLDLSLRVGDVVIQVSVTPDGSWTCRTSRLGGRRM
jgi:hypothetical protein